MQTDASIDFTVIGQRVTHFFPWRKRCECHYDDAFWPLKAIKNGHSVIHYLPSCRSKFVRPSFTFGTQMKIFLMKSKSFLTLHKR